MKAKSRFIPDKTLLSYDHNPSQENGLVLVGAAAGILAGGLTGRALTPRTSTVYRAQGGTPPNASWKRITVDEQGNVSIAGKRETMLYVNLDDKTMQFIFIIDEVDQQLVRK